MTIYEYKAKTEEGKIRSGSTAADSQEEVAELLKGQGLTVLGIEKERKSKEMFVSRKISMVEKITLCRYLSTMIQSGLSLSMSVGILQEETENVEVGKLLSDMEVSLRKGEAISTVLSRYPQHFDDIFVTVIRAGEKSGTLGNSFDYLRAQLEASHRLSEEVKQAMIYPAVIVSAMGGIGILMFTFVIPKVGEMFLKMNMKLPIFTKILLESAMFASKHVVGLLGGVVGLILGLVFFFKSRTGKKFSRFFISKTPLLNKVVRRLDLARFTRTLSTLLKSGVPIVESLSVSARALSLVDVQEMGNTLAEGVTKGEALSKVLKKVGFFPSLMVRMVSAGEAAGELDKMLLDLSEFYRQEVEDSLKRFLKGLEPVLMVIIGVAVGAMVLAVVSPIYQLVGGLKVQ